MATGPFFYYVLWSDVDIQNILDKTLSGLGYELVGSGLAAQGDLRIFIDKEGGITVENCATVNNHLNCVFTVEDVNYKRLEISSPDLDRPLKKAADFVRFTRRQAKIKTCLPVDGQENFIDRIENCKNGMVSISLDGKNVDIEFGNIDKARLRPESNF